MAVRFSLYVFSKKTGAYLQEVIKASPQGIVARTSLLTEALPAPEEVEADIWFIEYDEQMAGLDLWIENTQHQTNPPAVFLFLQEASTETLLKALRLGVQECFINQINEEDFQKAICRVIKTRKVLKNGEKTQIIALLGCKGGAGVTFLSVNLSQSLALDRDETVLLLDLDLRHSGVSAFLDNQPRYTILDIIHNFDRLDPQYLKDIVHSRKSGLDILPGPLRLEDSELVTAIHVDKFLHYLRTQNLYRWIVLDLGDHLDELTLKALEHADLVLLVTLLIIPGLRDAKKILEMLQLLQFGEGKIQTLANCYNKETDITPEEAQKFLGQNFLGILRFDHEEVVRSINEGQLLVDTQPRNRLSIEISELVKAICQDDNNNGQLPSRWDGLKRLLRLGGKI